MDSGPADELPVDPVVVEQTGIWRLPDPSADLELTAVFAVGPAPEFQVAVDDPDDPTRWLAVSPGSYSLARSEHAGDPVALPLEATAVVVEAPADHPLGSTWVEVTGASGTGSVTLAATGVSTVEVLDTAAELVNVAGNLTDPVGLNEALSLLRVPDGLNPAWTRVGIPDAAADDVAGLGLMVEDRATDRRLGIRMDQAAPTAALAALNQLLIVEASRLSSPEASAFAVTQRPDLGPSAFVVEGDGASTVTVFSNDGVSVQVDNAMASDAVVDPGSGIDTRPLSINDQVQVINQLRAISYTDFFAELERLGVEFGRPGP